MLSHGVTVGVAVGTWCRFLDGDGLKLRRRVTSGHERPSTRVEEAPPVRYRAPQRTVVGTAEGTAVGTEDGGAVGTWLFLRRGRAEASATREMLEFVFDINDPERSATKEAAGHHA